MSTINTAPVAAPAPSEAPVENAPESTQELETNETPVEGEGLETSAEGQPEGDKKADKKTEAIKKEVAKTLKKLKIKYNKQEIEEELPFEIPDTPEAIDYMTKQLQMSKLGHTNAAAKAQIEKQVAEFIDALKKDPRAVLQDPNLGVDLKKLAADIIEEEIANSKKSPEQIEKEKIERELKALKDQYEKEKTEARDREFSRMQQLALEQYEVQLDTALKDSNLPKSPYVVKKIADYMLLGVQDGMDLSVKDVLPLVEQEIQSDIQSMFAVMPEEVVQKIIGKDKLNSIRKKSVAKAKEAPPTPLSKSIKDVGQVKTTPKQSSKTNYKDFFKF